jgi:hypothetical protein
MPESAPLVRSIQATIPALGAAVAGDQTLGKAPFAGTVTAVTLVPEAAITGDNTNTRTLTLVNKGQTGAGSTVVATLAFTTGVNGVAFDERAFTLSAVANATTVAEGGCDQRRGVVLGAHKTYPPPLVPQGASCRPAGQPGPSPGATGCHRTTAGVGAGAIPDGGR